MLGIITGGGTKFSDGETYDLDVQLSALVCHRIYVNSPKW